MNSLIQKQPALDSREVAEMVGKRHDHLIRDVKNYIEHISTNPNLGALDFFIESIYIDGKGEERPNYQITKKGCEFIAHKLTGEKGALFTAAYINRFHQLNESQTKIISELSPQLQLLINMELKQKQIEAKTTILEHRINSLDATNIEGTPRQRLNSMIRKFAYDNGVLYVEAWKRFRSNFNTAINGNS